MNRLLFTDRITIAKDHLGEPVVVEGVVTFTWLGRHLPECALAAWAALMLLFAFLK